MQRKVTVEKRLKRAGATVEKRLKRAGATLYKRVAPAQLSSLP